MHCSSCSPLLDRYREGLLTATQSATVRAHLKSCAHCAALLDELRVVDALLMTVRPPEPVANLTFAVMAEVRSMPVPRTPRTHLGALLGFYIVVAWTMIALWLHFASITPASAFASIMRAAAQIWAATQAFSAGAAGSFGHGTSFVPTIVLSALALDLAFAGAIALLYIVVRPRLAAHLATIREVP